MNAATVLVEEILARSITVVIIDVIGTMRGLRAAGTGAGLSIAVLGVFDDDVPLGRGSVVANLFADGVSAAILNVTKLMGTDGQVFVAGFLVTLVSSVRRTQRNVHVIVEEAASAAAERATLTAQGGAAASAVQLAVASYIRRAGRRACRPPPTRSC